MTPSHLRRTVVLSLLLVAARGAAALAGLWHPNPPSQAMQVYLPKITLPTVIVAGLVDGINPCAFTVLLLFITAMLASLQARNLTVRAGSLGLLGAGLVLFVSSCVPFCAR